MEMSGRRREEEEEEDEEILADGVDLYYGRLLQFMWRKVTINLDVAVKFA